MHMKSKARCFFYAYGIHTLHANPKFSIYAYASVHEAKSTAYFIFKCTLGYV